MKKQLQIHCSYLIPITKNAGHTITEIKDIEEMKVNMKREEIKEKYPGWEIKEFGKEQIIFYKEQEGICNEHYIIKDNNGYVSIYLIDEQGKEELKELTEIVTAYLPQTDKDALEQGIKVVGREQLNATLEDFE